MTDRLDDVFAIQDEIARTIVNTLRATSFAISPSRRRSSRHRERAGIRPLPARAATRGTSALRKASPRESGSSSRRSRPIPVTHWPTRGSPTRYALHVDYRSVAGARRFRARESSTRARRSSSMKVSPKRTLRSRGVSSSTTGTGAERQRSSAARSSSTRSTRRRTSGMRSCSHRRAGSRSRSSRRTLRRRPTRHRIHPASLGYVYFYARRFEQAKYHLIARIEMNPVAEESYRVLGLILVVRRRSCGSRAGAAGSARAARCRDIHESHARARSRAKRRHGYARETLDFLEKRSVTRLCVAGRARHALHRAR